MSQIIKIGQCLTELVKKQNCAGFFETRCSCLIDMHKVTFLLCKCANLIAAVKKQRNGY